MARILAVDDDDLVRRGLVRILASAGHDVDEASDGEEAWVLQAAAPYDLILTDLYMPHVDGIEFLTRLSETETATRVIAISGGGRVVGDTGVLSDAEAFGASATLQKPFTPDEVLDLVDGVLNQGD